MTQAQKRSANQKKMQKIPPLASSAKTGPRKAPAHNGPTIRKKKRTPLFLLLGVITLIGATILGFVLIARWQTNQQNTKTTNQTLQLIDPLVLQEVTDVNQSTWEAVGTGNVTDPVTLANGASPLRGSHGLPELFYLSGEFCPNCAAERWALLSALGRFGTFEQVKQIQSYEGQISTVSFYGSRYTSAYLDFVPVETLGNTVDDSGKYVTLQAMTPEQQQLVSTSDSTGGVPFIDIGNRFLFQGASYAYTSLEDSGGNPLSWQQIASSLSDPGSILAQNILGTANYLTAALCIMTDQQPENVCQVATIQQIEHLFGTTTSTYSAAMFTGIERLFAEEAKNSFYKEKMKVICL